MNKGVDPEKLHENRLNLVGCLLLYPTKNIKSKRQQQLRKYLSLSSHPLTFPTSNLGTKPPLLVCFHGSWQLIPPVFPRQPILSPFGGPFIVFYAPTANVQPLAPKRRFIA